MLVEPYIKLKKWQCLKAKMILSKRIHEMTIPFYIGNWIDIILEEKGLWVASISKDQT
jgi:hypothetical protein